MPSPIWPRQWASPLPVISSGWPALLFTGSAPSWVRWHLRCSRLPRRSGPPPLAPSVGKNAPVCWPCYMKSDFRTAPRGCTGHLAG